MHLPLPVRNMQLGENGAEIGNAGPDPPIVQRVQVYLTALVGSEILSGDGHSRLTGRPARFHARNPDSGCSSSQAVRPAPFEPRHTAS